jgi:putative addiction module component (TIGR02574 family)
MIKDAIPRFSEFSAAEKLILLEEIWDDLAMQPSDVPVHDWHRSELQRRYQEYLQNPADGSPWTEVRDRLLRGLE